MKHLILGGARSGKSGYAVDLAVRSRQQVTFIATATAGDDEMIKRIAQHQAVRPSQWQLVEEPLDLAGALLQCNHPGHFIIVDCLTLWLSNLLAKGDSHWQDGREALLAALTQLEGNVVMISNEVGMGIVPLGELSRRFVDEAGRLHQELAKLCDVVTLVTAGIAQELKRT